MIRSDDNTTNGWMVGFSVNGAGFVVSIPSINIFEFKDKKIKVFTTDGWTDPCESSMMSFNGSGYNLFFNVPASLEHGKAFLCQFV